MSKTLLGPFLSSVTTYFTYSRYEFNKTVVAATCSRQALDITCWKQLRDTVQIGSSLVINRTNNYRNYAVFYKWEKNNVSIRGLIDTNWTMGFTYAK